MSLKIETTNKGAELISIKLNDEEKIFQPEKALDENGEKYWNRHAPVLFPIVGKLKENKATIESNVYEMGQHGFARDMEFELLEKTDNSHRYVLKSNTQTLEKYPYQFEFYITYTINNEENEVETKYEVINKSDLTMYFGLGGHPAFICDYSTENYYLEFEKDEIEIEYIKLEDGLVSYDKFDNILEENRIIKLNKDSFKEDAIIMKKIESKYISLKNTQINNKILDFGFTGFPYLAIWSKKGAPFVCIEPWFNTADKIDNTGIFKEKENILKIDKEEKFESKYTIKFY